MTRFFKITPYIINSLYLFTLFITFAGCSSENKLQEAHLEDIKKSEIKPVIKTSSAEKDIYLNICDRGLVAEAIVSKTLATNCKLVPKNKM